MTAGHLNESGMLISIDFSHLVFIPTLISMVDKQIT